MTEERDRLIKRLTTVAFGLRLNGLHLQKRADRARTDWPKQCQAAQAATALRDAETVQEAISALSQDAKPEPGVRITEAMTEERTGWLIEAPGGQWLRAYMMGNNYWLKWTRDPNEALCFATKEQADLLRGAVRRMDPALFAFEHTLGNAWPTEHKWMSQPEQSDD